MGGWRVTGPYCTWTLYVNISSLIFRFYFGNTLSVSQKFQMLSSKAVKKERKKYVKYIHQRWRGVLEKGLGVGSDDNHAGGKEKMTRGGKTGSKVQQGMTPSLEKPKYKLDTVTLWGAWLSSFFKPPGPVKEAWVRRPQGRVWIAPRNPFPSGLTWSGSQWFEGGAR